MDVKIRVFLIGLVFCVSAGAAHIYRDAHTFTVGMGSVVPIHIATEGAVITDNTEPDTVQNDTSSPFSMGQVLGAQTTATPRFTESVTKTVAGQTKTSLTLQELFPKKKFIYADVLGVGGDYVASLTGKGLMVKEGKLTCAPAGENTYGCINGSTLDRLSGGIRSSDIGSSASLLSIIQDETGAGNIVFNTNPSLSGVTFTDVGTSTLLATDASGKVVGTTTPTLIGLSVTGAGTSTFGGGINITGGCLSINGTCLGGSTSTGSVGAGTLGQLAWYGASGSAVSGTPSLTISPTGLVSVGSLSVATTATFLNASTTNFTIGTLTGLVKAINGSTTIAVSGTDYLATTTGDWAGTLGGQTPAYYLNRANHTGTQLSSTISDFLTSVQNTAVGTSTTGIPGQLSYWTGARSLASIATTTLTASGPLSLSNSAAVIGSAPVLLSCATASSTSAGCLSSTDWTTFSGKQAPITAGANLAFVGTVLNALGLASSSLDTSAKVAGIVSDKTGSGQLVFNGSPTFTGTALFANSLTTNASTTFLSIQKLFDGAGSAGVNGYILQSTGSSTQWVATSTLGFGTGNGTVGVGTTGQIPFFAANGSTLTGTSSLVISSTGNIGIGSTSPWAKFSVTNVSNSQPSFVVEDAISPDPTPFVIDAQGRVGIGSSSPSAELVITSTNPSFIVDDSSAGGSQLEFVASGANAYIRSGIDANDTAARFRVVRTGTTNTNVANFDVYASTTYFNGQIGIGTTTPQSDFHLHDATGDAIITLSGSNSGNRGIDFNLLSGSPVWSLLMDPSEDLVLQEQRSGLNNFHIKNTAGSDLFLLDTPSGNVSIGTSTLGGVLRVSDATSTTGALYVSTSQGSPSGGVNLATFQSFDPNWDRPLLRVIDTSTGGNAAEFRMDSPNPDMEFIETDQVAPSGKFEIAGQGNRFQINSRKADDSSFETFVEFAQRSQTSVDPMTLYMDSLSATRNAIKIVNATSSSGAQPGIAWSNQPGGVDTARISSASGASNINSKLFFEVANSAKVLQTRAVIDVNGNLGIGTTSPFSKLEVAGSAYIGGNLTATGTLSVFGLSSLANASTTALTLSGKLFDGSASAGSSGYVLQSTGSGVQWVATSTLGFTGGGGGSGTVNSGLTGQVPYYAANGTALTATSSLFISASGNVGIGTTSPSALLGIAGSNQVMVLGDGNGGGNSYMGFSSNGVANSSRSFVGYNSATLNAVVQGAFGKGIEFDVNSNPFGFGQAMVITSGGTVGIGTTTPSAKLSIQDSSGLSGANPLFMIGSSTSAGTGTTTLFSVSGSGTTTIANGVNIATGCFAVNGTCLSTGGSNYFANSGASTYLTTGTNLGIGSTTPLALLSIAAQPSNVSNLFQISTSTASATSTTFTINANGEVGIWTIPLPGKALSLGGSLNISVGYGLVIGVGQALNRVGNDLQINSTLANAAVQFFSGGDIITPKAVLTTAGLLGIGTTTPSATLTASSTSATSTFLAQQNGAGPSALFLGGSVGIGTSSPTSLLSVAGAGVFSGNLQAVNITATGTLTALGNSILQNASTTNLTITNKLFDSSGAPGANGQVLQATGSGVQWVATSSLGFIGGGANFFTNSGANTYLTTGTNLGIGSTTPLALLSIAAQPSNVSNLFQISTSTASATSTTFTINANGEVGIFSAPFPGKPLTLGGSLNITNAGGVVIGTGAALSRTGNDLQINPTATVGNVFTYAGGDATTPKTVLTTQGYFGIGTTTPSAFLTASSTSATSTFLAQQNGAGPSALFLGGNVGIGTTSPLAKLDILQTIGGSSALFSIASSTNGQGTSTALYVTRNGFVGVGTSSPSTNLVVSGTSTSGFVLTDNGPQNYRQTFTTDSGSSLAWKWGNNTADNTFMEVLLQGGQNRWDNKARDMLFRSTAVNPIMLLQASTGNVGLGTTSPFAKLSIHDTSGAANTNTIFAIASSSAAGTGTTTLFSVSGSGTTTIANGVNIATGCFAVAGTCLSTSANFFTNAGASTYLTTGTNLGIGTSSPLNLLSVQGSVSGATTSIANYLAQLRNIAGVSNANGLAITAGTSSGSGATFLGFYTPDNSFIGGVRQSSGSGVSFDTASDERIKENIATTSHSLADLLRVGVFDFSFKSDASHQKQTGFIAQNIYTVFPDAVATNGDNGSTTLAAGAVPWAVDYGRITPLIVKSLQEVATISGIFKDNLVAWLGSAENGLTRLVSKEIIVDNLAAHQVTTNTLCVNKSDGSPVCVTGNELAALLSHNNVSPTIGSSTAGTTSGSSGTSGTGATSTPGGSSTGSTTPSQNPGISSSTPPTPPDTTPGTTTPPNNPTPPPPAPDTTGTTTGN